MSVKFIKNINHPQQLKILWSKLINPNSYNNHQTKKMKKFKNKFLNLKINSKMVLIQDL